jgi:hypothetical protein
MPRREGRIDPPQPANDRGFLNFASKVISTYGNVVTIRESSAAEGPHVWLFITQSTTAGFPDLHLDLEQALRLRVALDQFIQGVPSRWNTGSEMLSLAMDKVFGDRPPKSQDEMALTLWEFYSEACECSMDYHSNCTCTAYDKAARELNGMLGPDWHKIMMERTKGDR